MWLDFYFAIMADPPLKGQWHVTLRRDGEALLLTAERASDGRRVAHRCLLLEIAIARDAGVIIDSALSELRRKTFGDEKV